MTIELILDSTRGAIEAPAGCGKTHLIVETLKIPQAKPYLVLTHTTAGVAALKKRLNQSRVPSKNYVLSTIDGWSVRIANSFRNSCILVNTPDNPNLYYNELRQVVDRFITSGNINDAIVASYSRLIVDEYQDCNQEQHSIVCAISQCIPTTVLGDPMQLIFNFRNTVIPHWQNQVLTYFPIISELTTPWRWNNVGNDELGEWVLFCRNQLSARQSIDLNHSPQSVNWLNLSGNPQNDLQLKSRAQYNIRNSQRGDSLLVIGDSMRPALRHQFASQNIGIDVVEPVDLRDLVAFANCLDSQTGEILLTSLLNTFSNLATGMGVSTWATRMRSILANTNRKAPSALETALADYVTEKEIEKLKSLLTQIKDSSDVRVYRVAAFKAFEYAVDLVLSDQSLTLKEAMESARERTRQRGDGRVPHTAIGSTLLLKGLETDHCLILDAGQMNQQNLYVALSRGAKSVTIGSTTNLLL
jgi:DNA helicase-2/ATP-dependent DNA helicase PcrA